MTFCLKVVIVAVFVRVHFIYKQARCHHLLLISFSIEGKIQKSPLGKQKYFGRQNECQIPKCQSPRSHWLNNSKYTEFYSKSSEHVAANPLVTYCKM